MGNRKSQRDYRDLTVFVLCLYEKLLVDFQQQYPEERRTFVRDFETLQSRVMAEGLSFLTRCLPKLGKAIDASFDEGRLEVPLGFKKSKRHPGIPAILQGILSRIYLPSGVLRPDASPSDVKNVRQFCYLVYKLELPYSLDQEEAVINGFLETERELLLLQVPDNALTRRARNLLEQVFQGFNPKDITPRHGPGAVATGEKLECKWQFSRLYSGIHRRYPYYDYYVVGGARELLDRKQWYLSLERLETGVAKVVLVPKDSRGPRLISCEPLEYQWIQQGLNRKLVDHLEKHPLTKGHINFSDQTVNQELALESSTHHYYCTIDLKDASDRVSLQLVKKIFPEGMIPYLEAVRSHATRLPDNRIVALAKYAPMGSAVCFSVEAACFWAICVAAVSTHLGSSTSACNDVYVYGDDIIVPSVCYDVVVEALASVGLKVNPSKCFHRGDFRESCGVDAFKGVDVTPTRISTLWSRRPSDGLLLSSYCAYANHFARKGYNELGEFLWKSLSEVYGVIPHGLPTSGFPNRNSASAGEAGWANAQLGFPIRIHPEYQTLQVFTQALAHSEACSDLDGWTRLLRNQTQGAGLRPEMVVLPRSTKLRKKWKSI